ncbi:hypothetical protein GBA65_06520 [Rubrobacter marinus]|uniref:Uncharacterized protein n=1 Tax=Rubrobacter marinus TaxID=2653852 RepID=A0A6G8PVI7_9ACTN|nr:hypothetical protein [Rubrobacter marinus]QIN78220.1 hypothetical protein GBA65_06520 [Rubrobacter marinus]
MTTTNGGRLTERSAARPRKRRPRSRTGRASRARTETPSSPVPEPRTKYQTMRPEVSITAMVSSAATETISLRRVLISHRSTAKNSA